MNSECNLLIIIVNKEVLPTERKFISGRVKALENKKIGLNGLTP